MKMNDFAIQILFEKVRICVLNMGRIGMKLIENEMIVTVVLCLCLYV